MNIVTSLNVLAITALLDRGASAAGTFSGRRVLCRFIEQLASLEPGPVFLDFNKVEHATASFLREAVCATRNYALEFTPGVNPIVANASGEVLNDLTAVLDHRKDNAVVCRLSGQKVERVQVLGPLDPGIAEALQLVRVRPGVTAGELAKEHQDVSAPAWNNRLSFLSRRGLIVGDGRKPAGYRFVLLDD